MPIINEFRICDHGDRTKSAPDETPGTPVDWRTCYSCIGLVATQLSIARSYLTELAKADFNDDGVCKKPIAEPVQGRGFAQIAATGLAACSD